MDSKVNTDQSVVTGDISCKSVNQSDKNPAAMETKNMIQLSSPLVTLDNGGFALSPITPDSNKENADLMCGFTSPLTLISSSFDMDEDADRPCTPKEGVFDPFAPGPDKLMLAPLPVKYLEESRSFVARRLNFKTLMTKNEYQKLEHVSETGFEDDLLMEAVYDSLLEAIIAKQAEEILAEMSAIGLNPNLLKAPPSAPRLTGIAEMSAIGLNTNLLETPPSAPRLTGIAETCPDAPMKPVKKSRNIDPSLCRKLEFDF